GGLQYLYLYMYLHIAAVSRFPFAATCSDVGALAADEPASCLCPYPGCRYLCSVHVCGCPYSVKKDAVRALSMGDAGPTTRTPYPLRISHCRLLVLIIQNRLSFSYPPA